MDNLTHTLIGAVVAETAVRLVPAAKTLLPEATRRSLYMSLLLVGSNFPDLDFVVNFNDSKLDYLLHHRGHTHTVVGALVIGLLLFTAALTWLRHRGPPCTAADRYFVLLVALLGPLLHLGMDATNNYGVHPFWPFDNSWFYGDVIFIIEPLFWVCAAPLALLLPNRTARLCIWLVLGMAVGLAFSSGFVPVLLAVGLTLLGAELLLYTRWLAPGRAAAGAIVVGLCIIGIFTFAKQRADLLVRELNTNFFAGSTLLDRVLTPMPVNPFCWEVTLIQTSGDAYSLRRAMLALAPAWLPAASCPTRDLDVAGTLLLQPVALPDSANLHWYGEFTMSRAALRALLRGNCVAREALRFMRAPWAIENGTSWIIGDLRYDREPGLDFAELDLGMEGSECPRGVPPWIPPRLDLLGPALL